MYPTLQVLALYFSSIVLFIMGILSFVNGIPFLGIIVAIFTIVCAICGFLGGYFNSFKLLWLFMVGILIVGVLTLISLIFAIAKRNWFTVGVDTFELVVLAVGWAVAFIVRNRSFQWGFINLGPDAKKPAQPLSSVV